MKKVQLALASRSTAAMLLEALSHTERLPLLLFLVKEHSEKEVRTEFPAIATPEIRRSLTYLSRVGWLEPLPTEGTHYRISPASVTVLTEFLAEVAPDSRPPKNLNITRLRLEVVALRRSVCRLILHHLRAGVREHQVLARKARAQSGGVTDAIKRLELAGLVFERRPVGRPVLHIRLLVELLMSGSDGS